MSGLIDAYLARLDAELRYDPRLARRVRAEIGGHLHEALDHGRSEAAIVAGFGNPRDIARDCAAAALPSRLRTAWQLAGLLTLVTLVMMRLRLIAAPLPVPDMPGQVLTMLDRAGLFAAVVLCLYTGQAIRSVPIIARAQRMRAALTLALAAFLVSIIANAARTLAGGADMRVVLGSFALELMMVAALALSLRMLGRHVAHIGAPDGAATA